MEIFLGAGVSGGGTTSEYVRQELRAVVGARTGQTQPNIPRQQQPQQPPQLMNQSANPTDLDMALNFDMATSGMYIRTDVRLLSKNENCF